MKKKTATKPKNKHKDAGMFRAYTKIIAALEPYPCESQVKILKATAALLDIKLP